MRVLQVGSDRSKRGSIVPGTPSFERQQAFAQALGQLDDISFTLRSDGFSAHRSSDHAIYPTNSSTKLFYGLDALRIARRLSRPDVVSAQDPFEAGLVAWLIARRFRAPLYVQVHTDFLSPGYVRGSMLNRLRVIVAKFVLKRASRIRVVSERIKLELANISVEASVTVLPVFVDAAKFKNAAVPDELAARFSKFATKVLVVSRLEPEKNVALAIRAFANAAPADACLIVVGDGSEQQRLEALARSLHLDERVFFEGGKESAPYYKLADLVLVTSRYEGYGMVIVEALMCGVPVLSTDVGIARESGAIVSSEADLAGALEAWFKSGPRTAALRGGTGLSFDEYVRFYCEDLKKAV